MATRKLKDLADAAAGKVAKASRTSKARRAVKAQAEQIHGPSPNPATNLVIADIALRGGTVLARQAVERALLGRQYDPQKAKKILKGRGMTNSLMHAALARVALRSIPGAIVVGGALVAKTLYDRSQARRARHEGEQELAEMAEKGEDG